jgi:hypothetical protein
VIIGLAGKKQVGKSTAAGFLVAAGFVRMSFAEPMKEVAGHLLMCMGLSSGDVHFFENHKEELMPVVRVSMRHFLQTLGTDWGRNLINQDMWVNAAAKRIDDQLRLGGSVVFEDVRFENEAAFIRKRGGIILHIERDTGLSDGHVSEAGIKFRPGDALIHNCNLEGGLGLFKMTVLSLARIDCHAVNGDSVDPLGR